MRRVAPGSRARVEVPATSANLGPGFDCMGLALDWYDTTAVEVLESGLEFELGGEGADQVPRTEEHLVVHVMREAMAELGAHAPGLRLEAHNTIPHSRGLGSSAAAIVAGLGLAWALARPDEPLDTAWACQRSSTLEGHPDNACAAVLGGLVLAWRERGWECVQLEAAPGLEAVAFVPGFEVPTSGARQVLPDDVPRLDAVAQVAHVAALVHALTSDPGRLLFATNDRLHQSYRAPLMPASAGLVAGLRAAGVPAVVSGAGPTVLALGTARELEGLDLVPTWGFEAHRLPLGHGMRLMTD